jgi:pantoate--beta-alanine ligase
MSSRNRLISPENRRNASDLFKALTIAKNKLNSGESVISVRKNIVDYFQNTSPINLEYFEIVRTEDLKSVKKIHTGDKISLCIAGYLGKVRLIDNISLN